MNGHSTEDFRAVKTLYVIPHQWLYVFIHLCKRIEDITLRMIPKGNYGLGVIMMCPCGFILGKEHSILVNGVGNEGGSACMWAVNIWEVFVPPSQFCHKPKAGLKTQL